MAWRGLHIGDPARLSLKSGQLHFDKRDESSITFPIEDIAWIVLDTQQIEITAALMAACMQSSVPIICSDEKHIPCGVLLPFHQHWHQARVARSQIEASAPLNKRLWRSIIRQKIENQAAVLERNQIDGAATLRSMSSHVKSGDTGNVEARAARFYWQRLFNDFRRNDDSDLRNAMLNYAYAILRGAVSRGVVAAGLLPAFGIHHHNAQNAFNLADDLLEVFRPIADQLVFELSNYGERPADTVLKREVRQQLVGVMSQTVILTQEQMTILPAIDRAVASLVQCYSSNEANKIELPYT